MSKSLDEKLDELGPQRRKKVEARAAALIAEEMSLRELRHARRLTQKRMAEKLHIGQEGVSRLEQRSDLLISTLRSYVEVNIPNWHVLILAGNDADGNATSFIMDMHTVQLVCKAIKVEPSRKPVRIGFVLPEPEAK